jgi:hypothetical protein
MGGERSAALLFWSPPREIILQRLVLPGGLDTPPRLPWYARWWRRLRGVREPDAFPLLVISVRWSNIELLMRRVPWHWFSEVSDLSPFTGATHYFRPGDVHPVVVLFNRPPRGKVEGVLLGEVTE